MIHLDTTFLVDFMRETRRGREGSAIRFLKRHRETTLGVSVHVLCELELGVACADDPESEARRLTLVRDAVVIVYPANPAYARTFGDLAGRLQRNGGTIGVMDLLIATAAVVEGVPLVTANVDHFERIGELKLLTYSED